MKRFHCSILMDEVKEKMEKLKEYGMSVDDIMSHLHKNQSLLQLRVSRNFRIFLGDERREIHLQPLSKAIYLLFLKHPEGILFKSLPDYRDELTDIYLMLKPNGLTEKVRKSIEDVTDPTLNSINEKCARVRGAFIQKFDEHLARYYYIDGRRAQPKKIALPRELMVWET